MKGDQLPDDDHVVRYVKPSFLLNETVSGDAFELRINETGLSVNWLEIIDDVDDHARLNQIRCLSRLKLNRNGRFARLNVGDTIRRVLEHALEIGIVEAPLDAFKNFEADYSHAEFLGLPQTGSHESELIGDLIAKGVMYPLYQGLSQPD